MPGGTSDVDASSSGEPFPVVALVGPFRVMGSDPATDRLVGAIVAASDLMMPLPLVTGGGQEKGQTLRDRALAYLKMGHRHGARRDLELYLQRNPKATDRGSLRERLVELSREYAKPH